MKFNFDNYGSNTVMHCRNSEEIDMFKRYLHDSGKTWFSGRSYIDNEILLGDDVCFRFNVGVRGTYGEYLNSDENIEILEFSDFDWIDDITEISSDDLFAIDCFLNEFAVIA